MYSLHQISETTEQKYSEGHNDFADGDEAIRRRFGSDRGKW